MMGLLVAADATLTIKYVTRMVANQAGMSVTFLPKPLYGEAGSVMHFHQQLFSNNTNLFYDPNNTNLLSQAALYYIGGLLTHAPAVLAFTNPSTNSYRRLIPGFEAPVNCFFSSANRSAAIRIPKYATQPDKVCMEFRPPDGTCNPYLAMAAMLMAGIDGIRQRIDPAAAGFGPIDEDIFTWSHDQRSKIKNLPTSLDESLQALQKDNAFLLEGNVFDDSLIEDWISSKQKEDYELTIHPHPFEIQKYFDY
jgi:glutamine synthetase